MVHCKKTQLSIFLTTKCNLQCIYCFASEKKDHSIPSTINIKFVKRGILDFFKSYKSREIRFFGIGEPTTVFLEMKKIREWVFKITNGNCKFELQTNGYFSQNIGKWIAKNIDIVWISCDGSPEVQNFYRPTLRGQPTSDVVEKNIRSLASSPIVFGCRATIGLKNIGKQKKMIEYFDSLGVKAVMSDPIFAPIKNNKNNFIGTEKIDLLEYAKQFLKARKYAEKKNIFYGSILTVNFDERTEFFCRACIPYPHLTTDGFVTCCDMAYTGNDPNMKELVYGKYISKKNRIIYNKSAINRIQSRKASNMPNCQKCDILYNCAGACLGEAVNETGNMFGIKPEVCQAIKYLARHMPLNNGLYSYLHP